MKFRFDAHQLQFTYFLERDTLGSNVCVNHLWINDSKLSAYQAKGIYIHATCSTDTRSTCKRGSKSGLGTHKLYSYCFLR